MAWWLMSEPWVCNTTSSPILSLLRLKSNSDNENVFSLLGLWIVRPYIYLDTLGILEGAFTGIALSKTSTLAEGILSASASNGTLYRLFHFSRLNFQRKNSLYKTDNLGIAASQL
ncbi:hypothetical protein TNIN_23071 [Trichonephila inaurata madagascariensis]|uniref:Uncharacterized protein n=1 Tax=Trichonephila inaurata madagascariensis TaxID=2747483 RepID=A0A8X6XBT1_9ARAC|nr:hypothetical protein TNIN_187451 [Trichonephila inaurata madagascariensis]GFY63897.1 hypothetical protein TNIN_23071 [Trichonephila inaurata madagascariensis]